MGIYPEEWSGKTVGTILREARESRGVSIDEAARVTRIGKSYLAALEADHHDKLPNPAYAKGFMRIYAGFLGLSGDILISRFEESIGIQANSVPEKQPSVSVEEKRSVFRGKGRWYIPLLLLFLVVVLSLFWGEREEKTKFPQPVTPPLPQVVPPTPLQDALSSAKSPVPPAAVPPVGEARENAADRPRPQVKGLILRLKVNQESMLGITIDNSFFQQYDLRAGDLIEWKGERTFSLDLSNAGGVEAELNGKPLPAFGGVGKSAHVVLNAEGEEKKGQQ